MPCFSIGYFDGDRVEVTLTGIPADSTTEGYDWITATAKVQVAGFKGEVSIHLCVSDLIRFKAQLEPMYRNLHGTAEFRTIEDQLYIHTEVDKLGHVQATGYLRGNLISGNKLNYEIQYDQTLLWHTISEIDEALFELSQNSA